MKKTGKVWLAGAGPGDAGLLTVKTKELLNKADVIVYDALVSPEILCLIPKEKELIYVGKRSGHHTVPQEEINDILLNEAKKGKAVLRLKGGDPFVFGRGGEELEKLAAEGISYEVIPGIVSAISVPAYAGIPVTHRDFVSDLHIITGHARKGGQDRINYQALVDTGGTLLFLMGIAELENITRELLQAGMDPSMPVAIVMKGTTKEQRCVRAELHDLCRAAREEKIASPAVIIVGRVAALRDQYQWTEKRPLDGRMFAVTRPREQISTLAAKLRELGAQVLELPAICTCPIRQNEALKELAERSKAKERWLVFTSPAGVRIFFEELQELSLDLRKIITAADVIKVAAIGSATAKALEKKGLMPDLVPKQFYAKELGISLSRKALPGSEIMILRAKEGSKELIPPLQRAGLLVKDIPVYETKHELHKEMQEMVTGMIENDILDGVLFTSKSTVEGFTESVPDAPLEKIRAICIGEQTAEGARSKGMQVETAREVTIASMITLIQDLFGRKNA